MSHVCVCVCVCVRACICSAGPLVVAMVLTLAVVAKATLNFLDYTRVSEERFKALLARRQRRVQDLGRTMGAVVHVCGE
eukprot:COSAG05_NODE_1604_length_4427_cov_5.080869_5_plen_79_part_00